MSLVSESGNIKVPIIEIKDILIDKTPKTIIHLEKIDYSQPWGGLTILVRSKVKARPAVPIMTNCKYLDLIFSWQRSNHRCQPLWSPGRRHVLDVFHVSEIHKDSFLFIIIITVFLDEDRKKYQSLTENNSELLFGKSDYAIEYYPPRVIIGKE